MLRQGVTAEFAESAEASPSAFIFFSFNPPRPQCALRFKKFHSSFPQIVEESQGVSEGRANGVETSDWLGVSLSMCYGCLPSLVIYQNNKMCPWRGWCLLFIKHAPSLVSNSVFEMAPSHVVFIDFISLVYYCGFSYFNNLRFL